MSIHSQNADWIPTSQRNLNNAFAYDLVPSPSVLTAALKAARRVNDFPTAVRIFEGKKSQALYTSHSRYTTGSGLTVF